MALPSRLKNNDDLYQPLADINVTPLVDVMLVLLIIFMITAPLLAKGVKVNLPQAKAAQPLNQKDPIIVTIGKDGKISLGSDATTIEALVDGVRTLMGDDLTRVVHVRGDNDAVYGEVVKVMDRLASNGITHIAIMTNSRKQADAAGSDPAATSASPTSPLPPPRRCRSPPRLQPPLPRLLHQRGGRGNDRGRVFLGASGRRRLWRAQLSACQAALARPGRHGGGGARSCRHRFFLMTVAIEKVTPLESVTMDLVPEGDMFESEQVEATDEVVPPEEMEQPDLAIPLPEVMTPDATPIPLKKEVQKKRVRRAQAGRRSQGASRRAGASPHRHRGGTRHGQPVASRLQGAVGRRDPSSRAEQFVARGRIGVLQLPCVVRWRHDGHQLLGFVGRARFVVAQRDRRDSRAAAAWRWFLRGARRPLPLNDRGQGFFRSAG